MYVLVCIGLFSTPFAADFGPGLERALEGRAAGRGVCSLRLSPLTLGLARRRTAERRYSSFFPLLSPSTSGLAWRRRWRGAQLHRELAFYASRHRLWARPRWGGQRGGAQLDAEFAFLCFSPPSSGLPWMGQWRGALPCRGVCLSIFHSLASLL